MSLDTIFFYNHTILMYHSSSRTFSTHVQKQLSTTRVKVVRTEPTSSSPVIPFFGYATGASFAYPAPPVALASEFSSIFTGPVLGRGSRRRVFATVPVLQVSL